LLFVRYKIDSRAINVQIAQYFVPQTLARPVSGILVESQLATLSVIGLHVYYVQWRSETGSKIIDRLEREKERQTGIQIAAYPNS